MVTHEEWWTLAERAANASGRDRELDDAIWWPVSADGIAYRDHNGERQRNVAWGLPTAEPDWRPLGPYNYAPDLTASIDAIVALIERELPWVEWTLSSRSVYVGPDRDDIETLPCATLVRRDVDEDAEAKTPTLALCAAFCRAKAEIARVEEAALAEKEPTP